MERAAAERSTGAADVVLVIDSDVPWIGAVSRPRADARVFHIDADALKQQMPLWYIGSELQCQADAATALPQIRAAWRSSRRSANASPSAAAARSRARSVGGFHRAPTSSRARSSPRNSSWPRFARRSGEDAIVVSEAVTNFHVVSQHMRRTGSRNAVLERRRLARLQRRRGVRHQAREARRAGGGDLRRRVLSVLPAFGRALDGAALSRAVPARRAEQRRLARAAPGGAQRVSARASRRSRRTSTSISRSRPITPASPPRPAARMRSA